MWFQASCVGKTQRHSVEDLYAPILNYFLYIIHGDRLEATHQGFESLSMLENETCFDC